MSDTIPIDSVELLRLEPGDVLLVRVGLTSEELGDQSPWIPGENELDQVRDDLEQVLPEGVKSLVTHIGVNAKVVREA